MKWFHDSYSTNRHPDPRLFVVVRQKYSYPADPTIEGPMIVEYIGQVDDSDPRPACFHPLWQTSNIYSARK